MNTLNRRLSIASMFLLGAAIATADNWIKDAATGCAIWNPNPAQHETIVWRGPIEDGKASGHGVAIWHISRKETERAEGHWCDGRLDGYAVWSHANGASYQGQWKAGAKDGYGIYTWPNAGSFLGEYRKDQRVHGRTLNSDGTPQKRNVPRLTRTLVYKAQDAAILARKAATQARIQKIPQTILPAPAPTLDTKPKPNTELTQPATKPEVLPEPAPLPVAATAEAEPKAPPVPKPEAEVEEEDPSNK